MNEIDELVRSDGLQTVYVEDEEEPLIIDPLDSVFSGEEAYGKRVDLYQAHTMYLNLRGANRLSYVAFLDMLRRGYVERTLDMKERSSPTYLEYVQTLYNYLLSFFDRALPLVNVQTKIKEEEEVFATAWEAGQIVGWDKGTASSDAPAEGIWCEYCTSILDFFSGRCGPFGFRASPRDVFWSKILTYIESYYACSGRRLPRRSADRQAKSHTRNKQSTTPTSPRPSTRKRSPPARQRPTPMPAPLRMPRHPHPKTSSAQQLA